MNNMSKQWKLSIVFHAYYQKLKVSIESFPCMTPCTLHQHRPLTKFRTDLHFIYITTCKGERKEELHSYYKMTDEEFLVPIDDVELSDPDIIGIPLVAWFDHVGKTSVEKKNKKEDVQDVQTDEKDSASK
jgi:hypothetical protein